MEGCGRSFAQVLTLKWVKRRPKTTLVLHMAQPFGNENEEKRKKKGKRLLKIEKMADFYQFRSHLSRFIDIDER